MASSCSVGIRYREEENVAIYPGLSEASPPYQRRFLLSSVVASLGYVGRDVAGHVAWDADGRREPWHLWQHGVASRAITKSGVRTIPTRFPKCTWSASSGPARTKATWPSTLFWAAARLARWRVLCADAPSAS